MATDELELIRRVPFPSAKIGNSQVMFRSLAGTLLYAIAALAAGTASSASSIAACSAKPRAVFSDAVGAAQKLPHGGWFFDAGKLTYTDGNMFQAQLFELGCIDNPKDEGAPCKLAVVRALKTNHLVYRGYRMPNLYRGIPGVGQGEHQED